MDIQVDPNLVNQAYRQILRDVQSSLQEQLVLYTAVANQQQAEIDRLREENEELKLANKDLMAQSGRQDGIPQGS
jgi:cell division protein FtsB